MNDERVRRTLDHLFRHSAGRMVATLARILGLRNLDLAEDVVQEALIQALRTWPYRGIPDEPAAWLTQVAKRKAIDVLRRDASWQEKRSLLERAWPAPPPGGDESAVFGREIADDPLRMVFACCDPSLSRDAQVALTLKTVGGFSTGEIARAFLVAEATVAQRVVRAKRALRSSGAHVEIPDGEDLEIRLAAACEVVYLMFNEGYSASHGDDLVRHDLCAEAIRLARLLCDHPWTARPRAHALLALVLLQASRLETRIDAEGELLLLRDQDRSRWSRRLIAEGIAHLGRSGRGDELTPFHLEAEIAACHAAAPSWEATDWARIVACYDALLQVNPSPVVALNRLVAFAELHGAERALTEGGRLFDDPSLAGYYPCPAVRGVLEAEVGRVADAARQFRRAAALTESAPVRRALLRRAAALGVPG